MSSPSDNWNQLYYQSISNQEAPLGRTLSGTVLGGDRFSEATVVTATVTPVAAPTLLGSASSGSSGGGHLSPEGRVSKPVRRRSRASRRTPTTLLNTDTTNFRAMVQQFTGGPRAPYAAGNATNFSLGLGIHQTNVNVNPSNHPVMMVPATAAAGYHHLQYHQPQQQQYQHQNQPRPSYMFSFENNNNNNSYGPAGHDFFLQRLGNPSPGTASMETVSSSGGFFMEGVSSQGPPPPAPPSRPPSFLR